MKKLLIILAVLLMLTVSVCAAGENGAELQLNENGDYFTPVTSDMEYSGPLDSFTNEPVYSSLVGDDSAASATSIVYITDIISYDRDKECFCYRFSDVLDPIESDVMDGMIVTEPVSIRLPEGVAAILYCNGEPVDDEEFDRIADPGSYVLNVTSGSNEKRIFGFTILKELTGLVYSYRMPTGFSVTDVIHNNENDTEYTRSYVDLSAEGTYRIFYTCQYTGESYHLDLEIDHTPPELELKAVVNGVAAGPVDISDAEPGAVVYAYLDGEPTGTFGDVLKESGTYKVVIVDEAGNETEYHFRIRVYFNANSIVFILAVIVVIVAVILFMRKTRKKVRVR